MSNVTTYSTHVTWKGAHLGQLALGNGPQMEFSAPPDAHGLAGVFTPEDAFVAATNTCIMLMFLWAAERFKLHLLAYECKAEGDKRIELDRTEIFTQVRLNPLIRLAANGEDPGKLEERARRALQAAQKYSLVANSIKSEILLSPTFEFVTLAEENQIQT
jgi:organic hydroperoxide reductase OsmC/OhrA